MPAELIALMLKQLPPSASELKLLDLGGHCSAHFSERRLDLNIDCVEMLPAQDNCADAIVALDQPLAADFLSAALRCLRPGGRLVIGWRRGMPDAGQQLTLEAAGFARILIETQGASLLLRGERPMDESQGTLERIRLVAEGDVVSDPAAWPGRYVHLLVRQPADRPPWARPQIEQPKWQALTLGVGEGRRLPAFSSLPRAVAFLQPAVLQGRVRDVNKVGKFPREVARNWPLPLLLNPSPELLKGAEIGTIEVDAADAAAPDE